MADRAHKRQASSSGDEPPRWRLLHDRPGVGTQCVQHRCESPSKIRGHAARRGVRSGFGARFHRSIVVAEPYLQECAATGTDSPISSRIPVTSLFYDLVVRSRDLGRTSSNYQIRYHTKPDAAWIVSVRMTYLDAMDQAQDDEAAFVRSEESLAIDAKASTEAMQRARRAAEAATGR